MGKMFVDMLKGAVVFAAVGAVIGLIFPIIAPALLAHGVIGAPLEALILSHAWWPIGAEAVSFGMFGALVPPIQSVINGIFGNADAKAAQQAQQDNAQLKQQVMMLEGREQMVEQKIGTQSQAVQSILTHGPRMQTSFTQAEADRAQMPESKTVH